MTFIKEKIGLALGCIARRMIVSTTPVKNIRYSHAEYKTENRPPEDLPWQDYEVTTLSTKADEHFWFCFELDIPEVKEDECAYLKVTTGRSGWDAMNPQATLFIDGETALQAFDVNHTEYPVAPGQHKVNLYFYATPNAASLRFEASVVVKNKTIEKLYYDMKVPYDALAQMEPNSYGYTVTLNALDRACLLLDIRDQTAEALLPSAVQADAFLEKEYYQKHCGNASNGELAVIGHTHIDVAWLWTLAQTEEKAQRSFATVISLMEQYPEYIFMSSQPQLYEYVKQNDPELYEKIKEKIREGRWEAEGAMWLEADTNLASGESLIRQILHGKQFMQEEFGLDNHILWLPDVFGYSAALPQILKKCGIDTFFTTKLCWNETDQFPHDNFIWRGIDGSEVFSVLTDSYSKDLNAALAKSSMDWHVDKKFSTVHPCTVGFADGGGGTTAEMMEHFRRLQRGLPGLPKVTMAKAGDTISRIRQEFEENTAALRFIPRWEGTLYLEMHRGTYTTMGKSKQNNRKSELLYQAAEAASSMAQLLAGTPYPQETLRKNWLTILKNQFHDIIPGSSIKEVYEDSFREYETVLRDGEQILSSALDTIGERVCTEGGYLVYNPTSFSRTEVIRQNGAAFLAEDIPAHGYKVIHPQASPAFVSAGDQILENECLRVLFDENFHIVSVFDKANQRELIREGQTANRFEVYEDFPREYDAWEITEYYKQKKWTVDQVLSVEWINEPLYAAVKVKKAYRNSTFTQEICLHAGSSRLDFVTEADWHEEHVLLKAVFPVDIHTDNANCDIQFGHVHYPTHRNTSWDQAQFEVCAHKWVDLSEGNYGVAMLNDCKYGYSVQDDVLTISLLKAPVYPNPIADRGSHRFTYSLYPHAGALAQSDVVKEAYVLNCPLTVKQLPANPCGTLPETFSFVSADSSNAVIETMKQAEDGSGVIIRLYESKNTRGTVTLRFGAPITKVWLCDMLEQVQTELPVCDRQVRLPLKNFEIVTLKVQC